MARCPYCDAEYTPGEMYCKKCIADLSDLDRQPVPKVPEPPASLELFNSPLARSGPPVQPDIDIVGEDSVPNLLDIPAVPELPLAPVVSKALVAPVPTADWGENRECLEAAPLPVGPVCGRCGATNDRDSKFCDGCGGALGADCPSCQKTNRPGANFCQHCRQCLGEGAPRPASVMSVVVPAIPQAHQPVQTKSCVLVLLSKEGGELARFPLRDGVNQVGAKSTGEGIMPEVDLSTLDTQQVISRRHAILRVASDRVTVADCGSTNGTRVDGTRIATAEVPVDERSNIMFGNLHARLLRS